MRPIELLGSVAMKRFVAKSAAGPKFVNETSDGGYFTRAILKAVHDDRAKTDSNGNGAIELAELYGVLKPSVVYSTGRKQTPWIARNQMVGKVPLF